MTTEPAEATARSHGWRQDRGGSWWRAGTRHDAFTIHSVDDDSEFGYVLASSAADALRVDRETFGTA